MYKQIILLQYFYHKHLNYYVYKMFKCDKNQMPYYNVQNYKIEIFENFGPSIKHGPH
jgi:hypothetical protein